MQNGALHCMQCLQFCQIIALTAVRKKEHGQSGVFPNLHIQSWIGSACTHKTWLQIPLSLFYHMSYFY